MKYRNLIIVGILALIVIVVLADSIFNDKNTNTGEEDLSNQEVSTEEPFDIVLDFYEQWLEAKLSTTTDPYQLGLESYPILSETLQDKLAGGQADTDSEVDPVLCQISIPEKIKVKSVFELENQIQFVVLPARNDVLTGQAIVTLDKLNEGWYIKDISCSSGESAPEREFSFEKDGYLLKSVPPPLDSQYWHIVFEENGQNGHAAPLFFSEESVCIDAGGNENTCDPGQFTDATAATVQGQMIEAGVNVNRIQLR